MSQWVFYLDESGDCEGHDIPIKNGQTPLFVLTAVALPISQWREYSSRYVSLKGRFFKKEINESSKPITIENILYVSERPVARPPFNGRMVHGCRLINFEK